MNFIERIRKAVRHLFGKSNVGEAFGIQIAVSTKMEDALELWTEMYEDRPAWKDSEKGKITLNLSAAISAEIARLTTIEMKSSVFGSPRADYLDQQYQRVIEKAREFTEQACAKGAVVLKPYIQGDKIMVSVVQADDFYPVSFDSDGDVTGGVFLDYTYIENKKYTRLEYHSLDGDTYTISNKAYCLTTSQINSVQENSLGKEVPLTEVPDWEYITPVVSIKEINHVLFSYFKMPFANQIESKSPLGVSCFSRAVDQIRKADEIWSEIAWEFESGERAVNVPEDMFKHDQEGKPVIPEGRERLYRTFLWEQGKNYGLDTYSPDFRDSSLFNGLNKTLHKIEFLCGLAYGTFSEPTETDKTATEVKQSKQRSFSTVTDVQKALEKALRNLAYCFDAMATLYELAPEGEYDMSFDWDDSIIVDREVEFARLMSMASAGMIRNEYVVAWYFGVSEEEAKKMMPGATPDDEEVPEEEE